MGIIEWSKSTLRRRNQDRRPSSALPWLSGNRSKIYLDGSTEIERERSTTPAPLILDTPAPPHRPNTPATPLFSNPVEKFTITSTPTFGTSITPATPFTPHTTPDTPTPVAPPRKRNSMPTASISNKRVSLNLPFDRFSPSSPRASTTDQDNEDSPARTGSVRASKFEETISRFRKMVRSPSAKALQLLPIPHLKPMTISNLLLIDEEQIATDQPPIPNIPTRRSNKRVSYLRTIDEYPIAASQLKAHYLEKIGLGLGIYKRDDGFSWLEKEIDDKVEKDIQWVLEICSKVPGDREVAWWFSPVGTAFPAFEWPYEGSGGMPVWVAKTDKNKMEIGSAM